MLAQRLRIASPQNCDQGQRVPGCIPPVHQSVNCAGGDFLPAHLSMGTGLSGANRQHAVEKAHPLPRPRGQIPAGGHGNAHIGGEFLKDIAQRCGERNAGCNRKTEAHRMPGSGVGVLADNEDFHLIQGVGKSAQDIATGGKIAVPGLDLPAQLSSQFMDFSLNRCQCPRPGGIDNRVQRFHAPTVTAGVPSHGLDNGRRSGKSKARGQGLCGGGGISLL